jgi:hypothetical protein
VKLELDENLPFSLKARLARNGHDADTVPDESSRARRIHECCRPLATRAAYC